MRFIYILILFFVFFSCSNVKTQRKQVELSKNWQFKAVDDTSWLGAKVPGVVHLDLLNNKIIPNPFDSTNEAQLQWIGEITGNIN